MTPEQRAEFARAETTAIYSRCIGSTTPVNWKREAASVSTAVDRNQRAIRPPHPRTLAVIARRRMASSRPIPIHIIGQQRDAIETVIARTGSIAAAMTSTGCTYRTARHVWTGMAA